MAAIDLKKHLSDDEYVILKNKIIPYLQTLSLSKYWQRSRFQHQPIASWILQRVFELGYDGVLHGDFDSHYKSFGREDSKIERIGKKYQWIAFHEAMARIADNYYLKDHNEKVIYYEGAFEPHLRNIDPSLTVKYWGAKEENENVEFQPKWWSNQNYNEWHIDNWDKSPDDLPNPECIVKDENNEEWIVLLNFPEWTSPEEVGKNRYEHRYKRIWYHLKCYIIRQKEAEKTVDWLKNQNFMNHWMPQERNRYEMFSREYYWSPAYRYFDKEYYSGGKKKWQQFRNSSFKGIVTAEEFSAGGGEYTVQKSIRFHKPSKYIFEAMNLKFGKKDGEFVNEKGEVICFDPSVQTPSKSLLLIKKKPFLELLNKKKFTLCWTVLGEKIQKNSDSGHRDYNISVINGAYLLNKNGDIEGGFMMKNRDGD